VSIFGSCTVLIPDPENPQEVETWCIQQKDFLGVVETDVYSDTLNADVLYVYMFRTEEAANWFKLRWL
jgi:hypothetical protein